MSVGDEPIIGKAGEKASIVAESEDVKPASEIRRAKPIYREVIETILLTVIIFFAVRGLVQNFKVEGYSMEPSLHTGQYLLVNKAVYFHFDASFFQRIFSPSSSPASNDVYLFHPPQKGEVIVFEYPQDPSRDFIKRVIGVAGDKVEIRGGKVFVNGVALVEPYIKDPPAYTMPAPIIVPPDTVFVLGDNRNNSSDSHVWGVLPIANIIGKAWISYWPPANWGFLPTYSIGAPSK